MLIFKSSALQMQMDKVCVLRVWQMWRMTRGTSISITCYDRNGNVIKQVASDDDANVEDDENNSGADSGDDNSGSGSGESNPL